LTRAEFITATETRIALMLPSDRAPSLFAALGVAEMAGRVYDRMPVVMAMSDADREVAVQILLALGAGTAGSIAEHAQGMASSG